MLSLKDLLNPTPSSSSSAVSRTPASGSPFDPLQHRDNQHHSRTPSPPRNLSPVVEHDVRLSNKTHLRTLFHHPLGTILEYPETSRSGYIGHLFEVSPDAWSNPQMDFAYSQGAQLAKQNQGTMSGVRCRWTTTVRRCHVRKCIQLVCATHHDI